MLSTIRSKVKFAGYAVLALCGLSSGVGLVVALMLSASLADSTRTSQIMRNHLEGDMMHDALNSDVLAALLAAEQGRVSEIGGIRTGLEEHAAHFRAMIAENKAIATDPGTIEVLTAVEQPLEQYIAAAEAIVALAATDPVGANAALPAFSTRFSELEDRNGAASEAIEATLHATKARADFLVVGGDVLIGLTFLLAIGLTLLLNRQAVRTVVEPIGVLNDEMTALSAGDTNVELTSAGRQDEIGKVGRSVVDLQALIIERARAEAQAQATQRSVAEQAQLAVAEQQAEVVTAMAAGLDHLMRGDLSYRIERRFPEGYEKLKADFNAAMAQLQETLLSVDGNASAIRSGAHEMTQATDDLSRRTEQQAASLEETAAALDEITATVNRTASGARQASETVQAAKGDAETSGNVVRDAVSAMGAIEKSAQEISQIIGVIDEIAFQTNLLALNAGVEAARAGDAGRGFAVVASEVRALAQRSAEAAKEIKTLISASTSQVNAGVALVGQTGEALQRIVSRVAEIDGLVSEIAASAQEQATGLAEVNTAINQMDQVTQQNAAMVEQSTAASHSLAQETEILSQSIGRFQLSTRTGRTPSDPEMRTAA